MFYEARRGLKLLSGRPCCRARNSSEHVEDIVNTRGRDIVYDEERQVKSKCRTDEFKFLKNSRTGH